MVKQIQKVPFPAEVYPLVAAVGAALSLSVYFSYKQVSGKESHGLNFKTDTASPGYWTKEYLSQFKK